MHKDYAKAIAQLEQEITQLTKHNKKAENNLDTDFEIVPQLRVKRYNRQIFTARRLIVLVVLALVYLILVLLAANVQALQQGVTSWADARWQTAFLTKLFDWLFIPGPAVVQKTIDGAAVYQFGDYEIIKWFISILISLIGWGAAIGIPTFLITNFITSAESKDNQARDRIRDEEQKIAQAKIKGRLEIIYAQYLAILTGSYDPIAKLFVQALHAIPESMPVVLFQSKEKYNADNDVLTDHVYLPDLSNERDYDELARVSRIKDGSVIILTNKPNYKFLYDPEVPEQLDLSLSDVMTFVENIRERTNNKAHFIICGSSDLRITSESYGKQRQNHIVTLQDLVKDIGGTLIDPDELIFRRIYLESKGEPVYIEFSGSDAQINSYRRRFSVQLARFKDKYSITVTNDIKQAFGGIFFIGTKDIEAVALSAKRLRKFDPDISHFVVCEGIEQIDEIKDIGYQAFCIDYELAKEALKYVITE